MIKIDVGRLAMGRDNANPCLCWSAGEYMDHISAETESSMLGTSRLVRRLDEMTDCQILHPNWRV